MPTVAPFIMLGLSAVSTAVNAVQGADAAGEAQKQAAAQKAAQDKILAQQQAEEDQLKATNGLDATRDAQLAALQNPPGGTSSPVFSPGYSGPSMFGTPGFEVATAPGSKAFGGL